MPNWTTNSVKFKGNKDDIEKIFNKILDDDGDFDFNKLIPMPQTMHLPSPAFKGCIYHFLKNFFYHKDNIHFRILPLIEKALYSENPCQILPKFSNFREEEYFSILTSSHIEHPTIFHLRKKYNFKNNEKVRNSENFSRLLNEIGYIYIFNYIKYGCVSWYDWSYRFWGTKWNACETSREGNSLWFYTANGIPLPVYDVLAKLCKQHKVSFEAKFADEDVYGDAGTYTFDSTTGKTSTTYSSDCSESFAIQAELNGTDFLVKDENGVYHYSEEE